MPTLSGRAWIVAIVVGVVGVAVGAGLTALFLDSRSSTTTASSVASAPSPAVPPPISASATAAAPSNSEPACGPDAETALHEGLSKLPPEPQTGRPWNPTPIYSDYDPCADLSTMLVMIDGGTGSSPVQAMMFHRGRYLGTGTLRAYGLTSLDTDTSTKDTVVLKYRSGQSCTACDDGIVTTVRYHWDGKSVQMLDPPPPEG